MAALLSVTALMAIDNGVVSAPATFDAMPATTLTPDTLLRTMGAHMDEFVVIDADELHRHDISYIRAESADCLRSGFLRGLETLTRRAFRAAQNGRACRGWSCRVRGGRRGRE